MPNQSLWHHNHFSMATSQAMFRALTSRSTAISRARQSSLVSCWSPASVVTMVTGVSSAGGGGTGSVAGSRAQSGGWNRSNSNSYGCEYLPNATIDIVFQGSSTRLRPQSQFELTLTSHFSYAPCLFHPILCKNFIVIPPLSLSRLALCLCRSHPHYLTLTSLGPRHRFPAVWLEAAARAASRSAPARTGRRSCRPSGGSSAAAARCCWLSSGGWSGRRTATLSARGRDCARVHMVFGKNCSQNCRRIAIQRVLRYLKGFLPTT